MRDTIELILCGIGFAGIGIFASLYDFFRQQKPRQFGKTQIISLGFVIGGINIIIFPFMDDINMMLPLFLTTISIPVLLWGVYDLNLARKCTYQVNAVCLYCTARKGETRPVFTYTYEGEYYKATSQQILSSNILVADKSYRIYINPDKPQCNIVFPKLLKHNKDFVILGAILMVAGIVSFFVIKYNLFELLQG
ncbi:MAG: hypothetical protein IJZ35_05770 [Clostridia bacterium]|nr:hypothetical protein [Clostridia bacterium]